MVLNPLDQKNKNSDQALWKNLHAVVVGNVLLFEMFLVLRRNHGGIGALGFCGILLIQFFYVFYKNKSK